MSYAFFAEFPTCFLTAAIIDNPLMGRRRTLTMGYTFSAIFALFAYII